jgi:dihydroorotate dehydrogenase (NAD+) catalytic subunit
MRVTVAGVEFRSPVIAASGTFGYGVEFEDIVSLDRIGGFVTKGLSREPMAGNPSPRIIETAAGMINAIGLQNMGVRAFIAEKLPKLLGLNGRGLNGIGLTGTVVIANVFGFTIADCIEVIQSLNDAPGIAMYELNASCPNTSHGGMVFGTDPPELWELVARCKAVARRPLMVKLSPNVTDIGLMARVAEDGGADAVSLVNTFVSLAIDVETRRPRIANITGGLSGPAIKPIAVRMVHEASKAVKIPVVGMGGILRAEDASEFMMAGATAVQVGTASYADPRAVENIANGLKRWCAAHDVAQVSSLTGSALL